MQVENNGDLVAMKLVSRSAQSVQSRDSGPALNTVSKQFGSAGPWVVERGRRSFFAHFRGYLGIGHADWHCFVANPHSPDKRFRADE